MQEDIVGTQRTITHDVAPCSLCGSPYPVQVLTPLEATLTDGVLSERADVCPDCAALVARGDDPVVRLEDDSDVGRGTRG
jgi:hypothetical protein